MCGAETLPTTKSQEKTLEVNEMRMLRWMCGVTRRDKIRNEHIRGTRVTQENYRKLLHWYGHVMRMKEEHLVRIVQDVDIREKRRRGQPNLRGKIRVKERYDIGDKT